MNGSRDRRHGESTLGDHYWNEGSLIGLKINTIIAFFIRLKTIIKKGLKDVLIRLTEIATLNVCTTG